MVEQDKPKHSYIFGDFLGKAMSKVDLRTQLEASMMSMSLMLIGLCATVVYLGFFVPFPLWYKIFLIINLLAGLVFLWSNLVTQYQQYQNYMEVLDFNKQPIAIEPTFELADVDFLENNNEKEN